MKNMQNRKYIFRYIFPIRTQIPDFVDLVVFYKNVHLPKYLQYKNFLFVMVSMLLKIYNKNIIIIK